MLSFVYAEYFVDFRIHVSATAYWHSSTFDVQSQNLSAQPASLLNAGMLIASVL